MTWLTPRQVEACALIKIYNGWEEAVMKKIKNGDIYTDLSFQPPEIRASYDIPVDTFVLKTITKRFKVK